MGLALFLACYSAPAAVAQEEDARLSVVLDASDKMGGAPDTSLLLKNALPVLWDRIVPVAQRRQADALGSGSMVARIVPGRDATLVEFHGERVFDALRKANIAAMITPPRFHLSISVQNVAGLEMQQTASLLGEEAVRLAGERGIELNSSGTGLVLAWQWLDGQHAELSVRGQSRLGEFSETREIIDADSLPALQKWLDEVLLKARDAYAYDARATADAESGSNRPDSAPAIDLLVQRSGSLLEQVALEDSLGHDPRVRSLLPLSLSHSDQRYRLLLQGGDSSWLAEWFARRGYRLDRMPDGSWVVR